MFASVPPTPVDPPARRPIGVTIVAVLAFFVAAALAFLAVAAYELAGAPAAIGKSLPVLAPLAGAPLVAALLAGMALLVVVGLGLLRAQTWAWGVAVALCAMSAAGDAVRLVRRDPDALLGLLIVGGMIAYLFRRDVRAWFWRG